MPRNRFLFDLLGLVLGLGTSYLLGFYLELAGSGGSIAVSVGGFLAGGFILGFFAYKNDGVKIAGIIFGIVALLGIIFGIIIFTGIGGIFEVFAENLIGALIGTALAPVFIVIAIMLIVGGIIIGGLFVAAAAIGSAIGEAIWKDKEALPVTSSTTPYQPTQVVTAPVEPTPVRQPRSIVCANCGVSNPGTDSFCTNCGAKLR
ncbi:MAG: hypothetical protein HGN29_10555 [Asgard group archaeon]|nr:hypothetical protein [Asgard group archaeon]